MRPILAASEPACRTLFMSNTASPTKLRIRVVFPDRGMMGPGKADLLALIAETGSIAAAGRRLGMSYKRAWSLVETMNAMFAEPVVESSRGGAAHGGAQLTKAGEQVLSLYRELSLKSVSATREEISGLEQLLAPTPRPTDMSKKK